MAHWHRFNIGTDTESISRDLRFYTARVHSNKVPEIFEDSSAANPISQLVNLIQLSQQLVCRSPIQVNCRKSTVAKTPEPGKVEMSGFGLKLRSQPRFLSSYDRTTEVLFHDQSPTTYQSLKRSF